MKCLYVGNMELNNSLALVFSQAAGMARHDSTSPWREGPFPGIVSCHTPAGSCKKYKSGLCDVILWVINWGGPDLQSKFLIKIIGYWMRIWIVVQWMQTGVIRSN